MTRSLNLRWGGAWGAWGTGGVGEAWGAWVAWVAWVGLGGNVRVSGCSTDGMSATGSSWGSASVPAAASGSAVGAAFFLPLGAAF